ncbi:MAG TPA: DUF2807 domain-containing protein [Saprospiraceae bacterium]|nr:DUF2807 domain-containing protein [Saprospiraceae bacterium]HMQ85843.1 DUF2807 domain-containing protein [Saprospiraceae bacterium]
MKYLTLIAAFLISASLWAQKEQEDRHYINYMTDPRDPKVMGSGEVIEEIRPIEAAFVEAIAGNGMMLYIVPGEAKEIKVVAQENILPLVSAEVSDGQLILRLTASLETSKGIRIEVPAGMLKKINIKEGGYLNLPTEASFDSLELLIQSGAFAECQVKLENFTCTVMGGATLMLSGESTRKAQLFVKGGSQLKGKKFSCNEGKITVLGASRCEVEVTHVLTARVENESRLLYYGAPESVETSTSLNGKIIRK